LPLVLTAAVIALAVAGACASNRQPMAAAPSADRATTSQMGAVRSPDECPTPAGKYSQDDLEHIRLKLDPMVKDHFSSVANGANSIELELLPGQEPLAERVRARFGDAAEIRVGFTNYCGHPGRTPRCPSPVDAEGLPPGLRLILALDGSTMKNTDGTLNGSVTVHQDGPNVFEMDPGQPLVALVVRPGTLDVVARYGGGIAGTGRQLHLTGGQEAQVAVLVGLWKCDGTVGSALPPGHYGVRVAVEPGEGQEPGYLSGEVPLEVTNA
jgi:hypothetical protein